MKKGISTNISKNIKDNIGIYFIITLFFAIGIAVGAFTVKSLNADQKQDLVIYLNKFFQVMGSESVKDSAVLVQSVKNNLQTVFFIWLLGITFVGIPLSLFIILFRGFIIGFTVSFLMQGLGFKGVVFALAAVIPQNIIYIPCLLIITAISFSYSLQIFKRKLNKGIIVSIKTTILTYTASIFILFLIMCIGCLIEAYITPFLLKLLSSYMIIQQ